jgi:hypothetical protein
VESTRNAAGLILVALLGGCSLSLSGPASPRTRGEVPRCDTGKGPVALDGIGAAAFGIGGLAAFGSGGNEAGAVMLGAGALLALSAIRGEWKVSACRTAFDEYAQEQTPDRTQELATMSDAAPAVAPPVNSPKTVPSAQPVPAAPAAIPKLDVTPVPSTPAPKPAVVDKPPPKQPPKPQAGEPDWSQFWQEQP